MASPLWRSTWVIIDFTLGKDRNIIFNKPVFQPGTPKCVIAGRFLPSPTKTKKRACGTAQHLHRLNQSPSGTCSVCKASTLAMFEPSHYLGMLTERARSGWGQGAMGDLHDLTQYSAEQGHG